MGVRRSGESRELRYELDEQLFALDEHRLELFVKTYCEPHTTT